MRRLLHPVARHTWLWGHRIGLALLFVAALLVGLARLFLPQLADHRPEIETWLGETLGAPVTLGELHAGWYGWGPALEVRELRVRDPAGGAVLLAFERAAVGLDPLASLRQRRPVVSALELAGVRVRLETGPDGALRLQAESGGAPVPLESLLAWLAQVRRFDLRDGELQIVDPQAPAQTLVYRDLRLTLHGGADERRAGVALRTPGDGEVQAVLALHGAADTPAIWRGEFWLKAARLDLARLPFAARPASGTVDAELWGDWADGTVTRLLGRLDADRLQPAALPALPGLAPLLAGLPRLGLRFDWRRDDVATDPDGPWQAALDYSAHDADGARIEGGTLGVKRAADGQLELGATDLPVDALLRLAAAQAGPEAGGWLARLQPSLRIPQARLRFDPAHPDAWAAAALVEDLRVHADGAVPGIDRLDGTLQLTATHGRLDFDAPWLSFEASAVFRSPFFFETARGRLDWMQTGDGGWRIDIGRLELATPGIAAIVTGSVTLPAGGGAPYLDLSAEVPRLQVGAAPTYLPDQVIGEGGMDWLDRGLVAGSGYDGHVRLRGRADGFPYRDGDGEFEARFRVEDTTLDFAPGWPRLENLEAGVVFAGPGLTVQAESATLLGVPVTAEVRIADLEHTLVEVDGVSRADGAQLQRILRETPVRARLGPFAEAMTLGGPHTVDLALRIPTDGRPMDGRGRIHFLGGTLDLPDAGWHFTHLHGALDFDDGSLSAENLGLLFGDEPMRLDVASTGGAGNGETVFRLAGRYRLQTLLGEAADELSGSGRDALASGETDGVLTLTVPAARAGAPQYVLGFDSPLSGLALDLPAPLGKRAEDKRPLALKVEVGTRERARLSLDYGRELRVLLELDDFPQAPRIERGDIRYNAGAPRLAQGSGVRASVVLDRWSPAGDDAPAPAARGRNRAAAAPAAPALKLPQLPPWLKRIDLQIGELELGEQRIQRLKAGIVPGEDGLRVDLDAPALAGRVLLPANPGVQAPLRFNLQRLYLHRTDDDDDDDRAANPAGAGPQTDPRGLPPMRIAVDDLRLNDRPLGRLTLNAEAVRNGLRIADGGLGLHGAGHDLDGSGEWLMTPTGASTHLLLTLKSAAIGETLTAFGFDPGIQGGKGTVKADLYWPRPVDDLELAVLSGVLHAEIEEGQLLEVEPGVGRVLGLVSLTAIARRLTLDFSDIFGTGFAFDEIRAQLRFDDGISHTEKFHMSGPSARVEISGTADLRQRTVDQHVIVTPRMGAALPIAGAIAGGPVGAAAAFVLDRVVGRGIDRIGRREYDIRGPWKAPKVEPSSSAPTTPEKGPAVPVQPGGKPAR